MITLKESMASITISGTETVQFENGYYKYAAISNTGGSDIYVSAKNSECTVPGDGVICIQPGASTVIRIFDAAFFISGEGVVQLIGQYDNRNPFKSAPTIDGGETTWIEASGNPVTLNGLQGGVPFGTILLSYEGEVTISENEKVTGSTYSGIVSESGNNGYNNYGWKAFDGALDGSSFNRWVGYYSGDDEKWVKNWVMYTYAAPVLVSYIEHASTIDTDGWDWKLTVYGSNDGISFDTLGSFEYTASASGVRLDINASKRYKHFKFQTWAAGEIRIFTEDDMLSGKNVELSVNGDVSALDITNNPFEVPRDLILQNDGDNTLSAINSQIQGIHLDVIGIKKTSASESLKDMYERIIELTEG